MARIKYRDWKPGTAAKALISQATVIARDYQQQGYDLTLRQLYYQFVARGIIPNNQAEYNRLGEVLNKARMAGLFDWDYIVDRTRNLKNLGHWEDPASIIASAASSFHQDLWANQPERVEVWVEKEALAGVVGQVANRNDVAYFACRGYVSASELWGAAQRLGAYIRAGQNVTVLHLGDHDPSGLDMTRDIQDRLELIINQDNIRRAVDDVRRRVIHTEAYKALDESGQRALVVAEAMAINDGYGSLSINRIALNMDQIDEYDPPPNPAKLTDSRVGPYIAEYGDSSWELDALDPSVLDALIDGHINDLRDQDLWDEAYGAQEDHRDVLRSAAHRWDEVAESLR